MELTGGAAAVGRSNRRPADPARAEGETAGSTTPALRPHAARLRRRFFQPAVSDMATKRSMGTLGKADLKGKKVFMHADLNVPLDDAQKMTDDTCIRASVPTIKFLLEKGAKVILASHLG